MCFTQKHDHRKIAKNIAARAIEQEASDDVQQNFRRVMLEPHVRSPSHANAEGPTKIVWVGPLSDYPPRPKPPPPRHLPKTELQNNPPRSLRRDVERFCHHPGRHQRFCHHQLDQFWQL